MNLLIDFGNSRLKWCLWQDNRVVEHDQIEVTALESGLRCIDWSIIQSVMICSVADSELTQAVSIYCDSLSAPNCEVCEVDLDQLPPVISLGSTVRDQIGKDRVMAMLGAFKPDARYCVIDAGTACTIDFVSSGEHQGGYIVPGLSLARSSLTSRTARIGQIASKLYSAKLEPGTTTQQAVEHGVRLNLIAICREALSNVQPKPDFVLVTGGDAEWVAGHLPGNVQIRPNLVFEGIARFAQRL